MIATYTVSVDLSLPVALFGEEDLEKINRMTFMQSQKPLDDYTRMKWKPREPGGIRPDRFGGRHLDQSLWPVIAGIRPETSEWRDVRQKVLNAGGYRTKDGRDRATDDLSSMLDISAMRWKRRKLDPSLVVKT